MDPVRMLRRFATLLALGFVVASLNPATAITGGNALTALTAAPACSADRIADLFSDLIELLGDSISLADRVGLCDQDLPALREEYNDLFLAYTLLEALVDAEELFGCLRGNDSVRARQLLLEVDWMLQYVDQQLTGCGVMR